MRWVDVNEQLPIPSRRVLVAMHAGTEWEFKAVGVFCWDHWIVDGETRLIPMSEVDYWAPIASTPKHYERDSIRKEKTNGYSMD